jgi:endonuclease/exonuclease/phosphatase family metal-dependent hydrolase
MHFQEGKQSFSDELHRVMGSWQGPTLIAGDFNLVRFSSDRSNFRINHKWTDSFNDWVNKWALIDLDANNRKFTWTSNQDNLVMAKIDRVFITTNWGFTFPLARIKTLDRLPSDHNPLRRMDNHVQIIFQKKNVHLSEGNKRGTEGATT